MYRLSTGERHDPWVACLAYPFRWFYSIVNALDYFRLAAVRDGVPPDERMSDAIGVLRDARQPDGTWLQERVHPGRVWFDEDVPVGQPSKWLTFYALRILDWWDAGGTNTA